MRHKSNYDDERLVEIDEELCVLLKKRKEICNKKSRVPSSSYIAKWAEKYDKNEYFLNAFFGTISSEEHIRQPVEPKGFVKHIPILKLVEMEEVMYFITHVFQYKNVSVLYFNQDLDDASKGTDGLAPFMNFELFINEKYDCQMVRGSGSDGHRCYIFNITPPLPEDLSGLTFVFKEYSDHLKEKETGSEVIFKLQNRRRLL
ncbi:hypothetical protein [Niallia sp. 03190]|uniref:hypothetical protein n=1 Tax=Niallia sp. 03190 TaxID=3458061 RepID=UPI0040441C66